MPRVLRVEMISPEIRIIAHLALRISQDLLDIFAYEGTREVARSLRRVDDRRTNSEHVL